MSDTGAETEQHQAVTALRALAAGSGTGQDRALVTGYLCVRLAELVRLNPEDVTGNSSMIELGLDSLLAIELVEEVHDRFGVTLTLDELLDETTVGDLVTVLAARHPAGSSRPAPRADPTAPVPLSATQQRLWFMHQVNPDSAGYTIAAAFRISRALRVDDLTEALRRVGDRHEALRTVVLARDGIAEQTVRAGVRLTVDYPAPEGTRPGAGEALELLGHWARRPFRFDQPPLLRAALVELAEGEHLFALAGHHVVFDAASIRILLTDLGRHYAALGTGGTVAAQPPAVQLLDYALWQHTDPARAARLERDLGYWRDRLRDVPPLGLPTDFPRPDRPTGRGASESFTVPADVVAAVGELARERDVTPFMILLATWQVLLYRHSGQPDVAVGIPVSTRDVAGVADTVGCFVDTLVVRTDLTGDPAFATLLDRVREDTLAAYAHPVAPLDRLAGELNVERHAGRNPLFEASFSLFPPIDVTEALPGHRLEVLEIETGYVQFDLVLEMLWEHEEPRARIRYTTDLYLPGTVRRMAEQFVRLLGLLIAEPAVPITRHPLLTARQWARLLSPQPLSDPFGPVLEPLQAPFERHATAYPQDIALIDRHGEHSYVEVDRAANQLAHLLREQGVGPEVRVGLALPPDAGLLVGLLAILKAGGAYVPVEPGDPPARIRSLYGDAGVRTVLTDSALDPAVFDPDCRVVRTDADADRITAQPADRLPSVGAEHMSYIIFTSGSTGRPKGVMVEHRHIVSFVRATEDYLGSRRGQVYAMVSSIAADLGLTTLLPALRTGGTVHVLGREDAMDPQVLAERLGQVRLDHLKIAPAHLNALLLVPGGAAILPTGTLVLGGEAVSWELVDRVRGHNPSVTIVNEYGPTETAVANIVHQVRADGTDRGTPLVPMSRCLGGNRAYVLDRNLLPVPIGVPGELYLGGSQVVRGYLNRAAVTAERFLADPYAERPGARMYATGDRVRWLDDSTMEFYGRIDNQVKIRGYRVEPGEVEHALRSHEGVREAVVLAFPDGGDQVLAGYVVSDPESDVDEEGLRVHLRGLLPRHLEPTELTLLADLPVLAHGKVDRDALRALPRPGRDRARADDSGLRDPVRRTLGEIWCDLLGVDRVGLHDNFFDLGGHSLLLVRMQSLIEQRLHRRIAVVDLMVHHTVEAQARHLDDSTVDDASSVGEQEEDVAVSRAHARRAARDRRRGSGR